MPGGPWRSPRGSGGTLGDPPVTINDISRIIEIMPAPSGSAYCIMTQPRKSRAGIAAVSPQWAALDSPHEFPADQASDSSPFLGLSRTLPPLLRMGSQPTPLARRRTLLAAIRIIRSIAARCARKALRSSTSSTARAACWSRNTAHRAATSGPRSRGTRRSTASPS